MQPIASHMSEPQWYDCCEDGDISSVGVMLVGVSGGWYAWLDDEDKEEG